MLIEDGTRRIVGTSPTGAGRVRYYVSGFFLPAMSQGNPPPVDDGLALVRLDAIEIRDHEDWAGTDSFGNADDGKRIHFVTTLLDEKGAPVYDPADESGDPITLEKMTRTATGKKSNFRAQIAAILTKAEFAQYEAATKEEPWDASVIIGRVYNVQVSHNKNGWPQIETFIGLAKGVKAAA